MSKEFTVQLPKLGESITSATIVQWFKKVGDEVKLDEPLLEVSTDKVNSEIPSPVSGVISKILAFQNEELDVGLPLCVIEVKDLKQSSFQVTQDNTAKEAIKPAAQEQTNEFLSPVVLKMAQEHKISYETLRKIPGTGEGGRITKKDVEHFLQKPVPTKEVNIKTSACPQAANAMIGQRIKMDPMRKMIADNMVKSFYTAPHASLIDSIDVTDALRWIESHKQAFMQQHQVKLSLTAFIALACAKALKEFPLLNSQVQGDEIVVHDHVNLGLAVAVGSGLLVPVMHKAETFDLGKMAQTIADKASRARDGKLMPSEVKDGSFTLTNFGMGGVQIGMPIIRFPEVAILAVGTITKACLPMDDSTIAVRSIVNMTLTFDHRVVDGLYGCGFINAMKNAFKSLIG